MTPQEAIITLNLIRGGGCEFLDKTRVQLACNTAISALRKQIPKKPNKIGYPIDSDIDPFVYGYCPCCNTHRDSSKKHCSVCGQALDWSDTE